MTKEAQEYVREWASRTGRAPSDIYVPEALRTVVLHGAHRGRKYAVELDVTGPSCDLATGRVSGVVRKIEDVT